MGTDKLTIPALLLLDVARTTRITALDWPMIGLYFAMLASVAWWVVRRSKEIQQTIPYGAQSELVGDWASIFASNIGSEHIVGLAGCDER